MSVVQITHITRKRQHIVGLEKLKKHKLLRYCPRETKSIHSKFNQKTFYITILDRNELQNSYIRTYIGFNFQTYYSVL